MRKFFILLSLLALVFSTPVLAADISGNWQLDMTNQMGNAEKWDMNIKVDGSNLTIDAKHPNFSNITGKGTLKGDKITMNFSLPGGIGPVLIDFEGTVKDNKMEGTRKVSYGPVTGGGAQGGSAAGGAKAGGQGGAPAGGAPAGGQGGAPAAGGQGGVPAGGGQGGAPAGGQGGAPAGGQSGAKAGAGGPSAGGAKSSAPISEAWTAVKK
jgi:hypothetical protein